MRTNVHVILLAVLLLDGRRASSSISGTPSVVAADVNGVEEPSTVALRKSGITHQVTAFIRRVRVPPAVFQVRDEWSYLGSDGTKATGRFAIPVGYTDSSDPVLAVSGGNGDHAGTVYAVGRVMNRDAGGTSTNPASIRVWQSADGGASFPGTGSQIDVMPAGATQTADKPWLAVSADGIVYVAWVRLDLTGASQSRIMLRRSRNGVSKSHICCGGLLAWDEGVTVSPPGDVTGPQIVFDGAGFVYVIWTDFGAREMRIARSIHPAAGVDGGMAFGEPQTVAAFPRIGTGSSANTIAGGIRVLPLASARYDPVTNTIIIAWTEGESDGSAHTDLRLVRGAAGALMTFSPVNVDALNLAGADQFTPVVDVTEGGNILLAWYDRSADTTEYQEQIAELSPAGAVVMRASPGGVCQAATVGEYQSLVRLPSGHWQLAWACSDSEAGRTISLMVDR